MQEKQNPFDNPFFQSEKKDRAENPFQSEENFKGLSSDVETVRCHKFVEGEITHSQVHITPKRQRVKMAVPESIFESDDVSGLIGILMTYHAERDRRARMGLISEEVAARDKLRATELFNNVFELIDVAQDQTESKVK